MYLTKCLILSLAILCTLGISAQSRELINIVNVPRASCTTCVTEVVISRHRTQYNCQPHPSAGLEGYRDLGYNIEDVWGPLQIEIIKGRVFNIFNANSAQIQKIRTALEVLPNEYISVLPLNFRIGDPNHGYAHRCNRSERINKIGGSKFCINHTLETLQFESIVIGCQALQESKNAPYMTILHECGHFISRYFDLPSRFTSEETALSSEYLRVVYGGRTSSHEETCAQAIYQFFVRRYFGIDGNLLDEPTAASRIYNARTTSQHQRAYPRWMDNFIQRVIVETSSEI